MFILVNYFVENSLTPLQKGFLEDFAKIKENFFSEWEKFDKILRDTYEICFYLMLSVLYRKKKDNEIDLESNLLSKYR